MKKTRSPYLAWFAILALSFATFLTPSYANDHGGGGGGGAEPIKLMVNLGNPGTDGRFLVCEISLVGSPEVALAITKFRPKIIHQLLLVLSDENAATLLTLQGKHDLADKIVEEVNSAIDENHKTGVHEALFTSFIIQ